MLRFAANVTTLFNEFAFLERFDAAADAGFSAVECQLPYGHDKGAIASRLQANNLTMVLHNMPAGNWAAGECGIACLPDRVEEFRSGVELAIEYATALGCDQVNCLAGIASSDLDSEVLRATFLENLELAGEKLDRAGIRLLVEPINTLDRPGFFLNRLSQGLELIRQSKTLNLWLQFDAYHMQIMEGDLASSLKMSLDKIAHIQISDNPGRHEPGTGEIDFPFLFDYLDQIGYQGWVGCEYVPRGHTRDSLGWLQAYQLGVS